MSPIFSRTGRTVGNAAVLFLSVFLACHAALADAADFQAAQSEAYADYREAAFYTRTGNIPVAGLALDEFIVKWAALVERYEDNPPPAYAGDEEWKSLLNEILERSRTGLDALDAGDTDGAAEAINPIREMLRELRRRNDVVTFSDHVDALTEAMDVMARYRREIRKLDNPEDIARIAEQADAVEAGFATLEQEAPPEVADDPEFKRLITGAAESMGRLREGLKLRNARLFRIGSGELRSYERIMFLRFG